MLNNKIANAVRLALVIGAGSTAMLSSNAIASDGANAIEKIQVTGSRIKRADIETASPVTVINSETIKASGAVSLDALLQTLTSVGGAMTNPGINNGSQGNSSINLRGLGASRTLVLLNGRRMIASGTGAASTVDLNTIPVAMIERVEVLKDGASAVYGTDAIAGVVNIILKNDFEGVEFNAQTGISGEGDADETSIDFTIGSNFDKGNIVFGAQYIKRGDAGMKDRDFSECPIAETSTGEKFCAGSSYSEGGHIWGDMHHGFSELAAGEKYQIGDTGYYGQYVDSGNLDDNGMAIPKFEYFDESMQEANVSGKGGVYHDFGNSDYYNYNTTSYLRTPLESLSMSFNGKYELTDEINFFSEANYTKRWSKQQMAPQPIWNSESWEYKPLSDGGFMTDDLIGMVQPGESVSYGRRVVESGPRIMTQNVDTVRMVVGLEGYLANNWDWNISYTKGKNDSVDKTDNLHNLGSINDAVQAGDFDPFLQSSWMGASIAPYIYTETNSGGSEMDLMAATLSGDLIDLDSGTIGFAAGIERRSESAYFTPDSLTSQGLANDPRVEKTEGEFTVNEAYVELAIPLLSDVMLADNVELSTAIRYFDYSTFGDDLTWKLGLSWKVNDELMLRSVASTAFRAPTVDELYGGRSPSFDQITHDATTQTQAEVTVGGNPLLTPEEADIFTLGAVYQPLDNLSITVDYYDIEISNAISSVDSSHIANTCLGVDGSTINTGTAMCQASNIAIDATGRITFDNGLQNIGGQNTSGIDVNASYTFDAMNLDWRINWDTSFVTEFTESDQDGNEIDYLGYITSTSGSYADVKSNLNVTAKADDWTGSYELRYISGMDSFATKCKVTPDLCAAPSVDAVVYHDISASYFLTDSITLSGGINNVLDEKPQYYTGNNDANTDPYTYDTIGRYFYISAGIKF